MRIKELLKEKHYTQQELADKMNVSLSAVRQMVAAESLTTATLEKIATALNVPMWQLFASPEEVQPTSNVHSIKCPKCGNEFPVSVNVELKTENNR
jgi:transcriptional regulator with XRE-family HTH domain